VGKNPVSDKNHRTTVATPGAGLIKPLFGLAWAVVWGGRPKPLAPGKLSKGCVVKEAYVPPGTLTANHGLLFSAGENTPQGAAWRLLTSWDYATENGRISDADGQPANTRFKKGKPSVIFAGWGRVLGLCAAVTSLGFLAVRRSPGACPLTERAHMPTRPACGRKFRTGLKFGHIYRAGDREETSHQICRADLSGAKVPPGNAQPTFTSFQGACYPQFYSGWDGKTQILGRPGTGGAQDHRLGGAIVGSLGCTSPARGRPYSPAPEG